MRQVRSPKQRHERFGKREESLIKGREGLFPTHGVAKEHHQSGSRSGIAASPAPSERPVKVSLQAAQAHHELPSSNGSISLSSFA